LFVNRSNIAVLLSESMLLMRGETSDSKEMANSAGSGGVEGGVVTGPVHATSLQNSNNLPPNSKINTNVKFSSQSPSEDKSIHYGLPCETDHMYANYSETATYRELANEVSHLKALLLFHLDLIQQQSELNASKDKQLSSLKRDNEMVSSKYFTTKFVYCIFDIARKMFPILIAIKSVTFLYSSCIAEAET